MRVHRRGKEKNREAEERSSKKVDEGNVFESKTAQDRRLCLWSIKRLEVQPSCERRFLG